MRKVFNSSKLSALTSAAVKVVTIIIAMQLLDTEAVCSIAQCSTSDDKHSDKDIPSVA